MSWSLPKGETIQYKLIIQTIWHKKIPCHPFRVCQLLFVSHNVSTDLVLFLNMFITELPEWNKNILAHKYLSGRFDDLLI